MANLQHIADRIFRHVDAGHLEAGYSASMGALMKENIRETAKQQAHVSAVA